MAKIIDPMQNPSDTKRHQKIELENITKEELLEILEDKKPRDTKQEQLAFKLSNNLLNQIKTYAAEHNTSRTNTVETIVTAYFKNKTFTRDYFTPDKDVTIIIPLEDEIRAKYVDGQVNIMIKDKYVENDTIQVKPFDILYNVLKNTPDKYINYVTLENTNNLLDKYDSENECYYSTYHADQYQNIFLNHLGVIILEHHGHFIEKDGTTHIDKSLTYDILLIHSYNQEVQEVRMITKDECCKIADEVDNQIILDYFKNYPQHEYIDTVQREQIDKFTLNKQLHKTKQELHKMELENKKLHQTIINLSNGEQVQSIPKDIHEQEIASLQERIRTLEATVNHVEQEKESMINDLINGLKDYSQKQN
ncbi:MAG: hypothetical protein SOV21_03625 [Methanosphaera sp.]|nr:hypothetical protein [Methanosphaera sp.]